MTAKYREIRRFPNHSLAHEKVAEAVRDCGFKLQHRSDSTIRAHAPLSLWSFGENIEVHLGTFDDDTIVDITSTCVLPTQIMDWGRNRRNVQRLFDHLTLGNADARPQAIQRCARCDYILLGIDDRRCPECGQDLTAEGAVITQSAPPRYLRLGLLIALLLTLGESAIWLLSEGDLHTFGLPAYAWILIVVATAAIINFTAVMCMFGVHHFVQKRAYTPPDEKGTSLAYGHSE